MNFKKIFTPFVIGLILVIPSFFFLLKPGIYWNMHDDMQLIRQLELEKCLVDGQIPCRWVPDLGYGYGYPLFNFYPPFPYFVGQIFRIFGFSFIAAVKLTAIAQILVSYLGMYLLASAIFGSTGGLISALFYTYAPYHAVNIYVRGAMNEAWASAFFPLILFFIYREIHHHRRLHWLGLTFSLAGLFLSHNPMTLAFSLAIAVFAICWSYPNFKSNIPRLLLSAIFALGLSSFYLLPVVLESSLVQIESMFSNYYHYSVHFTSLKQLFVSNYWGDGPSVWGQADQMSFAIGYLQWIVPLLILPLICFSFRKQFNRLHIFAITSILFGFFYAFLTHERSTFIWQLFPILQKTQFPWRLLNPSVFFLSLSVGILPAITIKLLPKLKPYYLYSIIIILLLFLNLPKFTPITFGPVTEAEKFSGKAWNNQITSGIYDYLPKSAATAPKSPPVGLIDQTTPSDTVVSLKNEKHGTDWFFLNFNLSQDAQVILGQLNFPNFLVFDHNKIIPHSADTELGRIKINLNAGDHQLFVKLQNTPIRTVSNFLSLISWISLSVFMFNYLWRKSTLRK